MEWKKIVKASFIPVVILFLIFAIGELLIENNKRLAMNEFDILWFLGLTLIMYIYAGYAAVSLFNLEVVDLIISGILAVLLFTIIVQVPIGIIFHCNISRDLNWCVWYYASTNQSLFFWFEGILGVTIGWAFAITVKKIKVKEKQSQRNQSNLRKEM